MPDLIPVNYDPFAPSGAAFGTLSPAEQGQVQPNFLNKAVSHLIGMAADAVATPGRIYNSPVAPTTEELIKPAADMAGFITLGAGAVPAEANALRAGIRPYSNVPDPLMGFRKNGPQKDFHGSNYSHVQDVDVTLPATHALASAPRTQGMGLESHGRRDSSRPRRHCQNRKDRTLASRKQPAQV